MTHTTQLSDDAFNPPEAQEASAPALIDAQAAEGLPTSFGVFKPVGHVMVGLPSQAQVDELGAALHTAGWPDPAVRQFAPRESAAELQAMVENAGALAGFGYEITLLRRYVALNATGHRWLLVAAGNSDQAQAVATLARRCGATLAVHYRLLVVEELIG